jgi:hypothetical protein
VPQCISCGSPVTDSLEYEVEREGQLKRGKYINSIWMCNDCAEKEKEKSSSASAAHNKRSGNNDLCDTIGVASPADVSPNTPKANKANL